MRAKSAEPLPLNECRRLLGDGCSLDDAAVLALRDQMYMLARASCAEYLVDESASLRIAELPDDERATVEERAAILEFDANMPRRLAERIALTKRPPNQRQ